MAASNRVAYVLTGEASGLGQTIDDQTKRIEKLEAALGKATEKLREQGKTGSESLGKMKGLAGEAAQGIMGMMTPLASLSGAWKLAVDMVKQYREQLEATRKYEEGSAQASKTYGEAFGRVVLNMPGAKADELKGIDEALRRMAQQRGLGEGGLPRLADAMAQIQSAIPLAPMGKKMEALEQTARTLELVPTENATSIGLGVAKVMEQSNWQLSGTQAMNLLRQQQTLGLVKDLGPVAQSIPSLGAAARLGQVPLPAMMGMAALMTQISGDTGGEETTTAIKGMTANLMTRGIDLAGKLDMDPAELQGNLFQRFGAIRKRYQAGQISEEQLGDIFPIISRGGGGKMSAFELLNGGWDKLGQYVGEMMSPGVMHGDMTGSDLAAMQQALPAQVWQQRRRQLESASESRKAGNADAAESVFRREEFAKSIKGMRRGENFTGVASSVFEDLYGSGVNPELAGAIARIVAKGAGADARAALPSAGTAPILGGSARIDFSLGIPGAGNVKSGVEQLLQEIRDGVNRNTTRAPTRPLPSAPVTSN